MSTPLTILHVASERHWGGDAAACLSLAKGLSRAGERSVLACPPDSVLHRRALHAGLRVLPVVIGGEADWSAARTLRSYVLRHGVEVVHAHDSVAQRIMALACWGKLVQRIVSHKSHEPVPGRLGRLALRVGADHFVAMSAASHQALLASGVQPERLSLILRGVDIPAEDAGAAGSSANTPGLSYPHEPAVCAMGSLTQGKGFDDLIDSVRLLRPAFPRVKLVIMGDGPDEAVLGAQITRLGLGETVHLAGFVEDGARRLPHFDVFCAPATGHVSTGSLTEAMAAGLPVVACAVGAANELVHHEHNGLLVPPGNPLALAGALNRLLSAPDWSRGLGNAGHRIICEHYSLPGMVESTRQLYGRLLARSKADSR